MAGFRSVLAKGCNLLSLFVSRVGFFLGQLGGGAFFALFFAGFVLVGFVPGFVSFVARLFPFFGVKLDDFLLSFFLGFESVVFGFLVFFLVSLGVMSQGKTVGGFESLEFGAANKGVGFGAILGFLVLGFDEAGKSGDLVFAEIGLAPRLGVGGGFGGS